MNRYRVIGLPDRSGYVILDVILWGYCTLPDNDDPTSLLPLEWRSRSAAEAWLRHCYQKWGRDECQPPSGWQPMKRPEYDPSPWE